MCVVHRHIIHAAMRRRCKNDFNKNIYAIYTRDSLTRRGVASSQIKLQREPALMYHREHSPEAAAAEETRCPAFPTKSEIMNTNIYTYVLSYLMCAHIRVMCVCVRDL